MALLGLIQYAFVRYGVRFLTVAILVMVMAVSSGVLEMGLARGRRVKVIGLAGVASFGFALVFLALGARWIKVGPGAHVDVLGLYFGFSAVCMVGLGWQSRAGVV